MSDSTMPETTNAASQDAEAQEVQEPDWKAMARKWETRAKASKAEAEVHNQSLMTELATVDGVMIEVQAYGPGYETFRASFPKNGKGVVLNVMPDEKANTPGGRVNMPLDLSLLDEEGWKRVETA